MKAKEVGSVWGLEVWYCAGVFALLTLDGK